MRIKVLTQHWPIWRPSPWPYALCLVLAAILCLAGVLALAPPVRAADAAAEEEKLRTMIVGRWGYSEDNGKTFWAYETLHRDGLIVSEAVFGGVPFRSEARYSVAGRRLCLEVTASTDFSVLYVGQRICADILAVNIDTYTFRVGDTVRTLYRLDAGV